MSIWLRISLIVIYYLIVVTQHENFGKLLAETIAKPFGRANYNIISLSLTIVGLLAIIYVLRTGLKRLHKQSRKIIYAYLATTLFLLFIAWRTIFVLNVEFIHIFQYGLLAFLLFPLVNHFTAVLFLTTLLGAFDELNQYIILTPDNAYYDLNDVLINFFGAVIGSIGYIVIHYNQLKSWGTQSKRFTFTIVGILLSTILMGFMLKLIVIGPDMKGHSVFMFYKEEIDVYWHIVPPNVCFHVISPLEFLSYIVILFVFYHKLGSSIR